MQAATTTVINETGLHARPASDFVAKAKTFKSKITIREAGEAADEGVNAKSIVLLLTRAFDKGVDVTVTAEGEDEDTAVAELIALVDSGFGEA